MKGIDISHHQGAIDFKKAKKAGIDFIIPRTGWGEDGKDTRFLEYVRNAQAAGIAVPGVYHFIYAANKSQVIQNAQNAIAQAQAAGLPKSTVIWCDLEDDTVFNARDYRGTILTEPMQKEFIEAFCDYILSRGYCTGAYVNQYYMKCVCGNDFGKKYDLWLADLEGEPYCRCLYRQKDWYGRVDGIAGNVDIDYFLGDYTAGTAKKKPEKSKGGKAMTNAEYQKCLMFCLNCCTQYWAAWPYNCLYKWGDGHYSADCNNTVKAIINSGGKFMQYGAGQYAPLPGITGDVDEWGLYSQCTPTSFANMDDGRVKCLYMDGHIGSGYGKEFTLNGHVYNTIETTGAHGDWGRSGTIATYTDASGSRLNHKGGYSLGKWERVGYFPESWVSKEGARPPFNYIDNQDKTKKYYKPILWALEKGYIKPTKSKKFGINAKTTRKILAKMIYRLKGKPTVKKENPYSDTNEDYATYCYHKGYIKGRKGRLEGSEALTRERVITIIWKAAGKPKASGVKDSDKPAAKAAVWARKNNIIRGKVNFDEKCPKSSMIIWFYRAFK